MDIEHRKYIHIDCNEEGTVMAFQQSGKQWETKIGPGFKVGKILSSDGRSALFFTCPEAINYRVAMGVAGSYARHIEHTWDIPF